MFESNSRYAALKIKTLTVPDPDGEPREIRYVERRFLPAASAGTTLVEHQVVQGERLDQITARYVGDPTQFWRVADANEVLDATELTAEVGRRIRVALPGM